MNHKDKELLLADLSARLPYGVKVRYKSVEGEGDIKLGYGNIGYVPELGRGWWIECKPYLRPMLSMTEEEREEFNHLYYDVPVVRDNGNSYRDIKILEWMHIDWYNVHHFDYRGLIERGLAIAVTEENNPYKE